MTREALLAFTQRLVERYAPEKVILYFCGEACGYGSLARGEARWDSDADILVVLPFEGRHLAKIREMRRLCQALFPLDLLVRRPEEIEVRYRGVIWSCARRLTMARCCMVEPWSAVPEWIAKAEGDWEALEILLTRNTPGLRDAVVFHAYAHEQQHSDAAVFSRRPTGRTRHDYRSRTNERRHRSAGPGLGSGDQLSRCGACDRPEA